MTSIPSSSPAPSPPPSTASLLAPTQQFPALATILAQTDSCANIYSTLNPSKSSSNDYYTATTNTADPRFSSCQPPGWDQSHFTFSPGVCPSDWRYSSISATASGSAQVTQAFCCAPNFFLENENRGTTRHCVHFEYKERVKYLHDAWVVRWQATDSLPLALPTVTGTQTITEWYPHNTATFSPTDSPSGQSGNGIIVGTLVLAVVLPVVTVSLVVAACVFGLRKRRQERRKKAEAQQQALEGQTK